MSAILKPQNPIEPMTSGQLTEELRNYKTRRLETVEDAVGRNYVIGHTEPQKGFYALLEDNSIRPIIAAAARTRSRIDQYVTVFFDASLASRISFSYKRDEANQWSALWTPKATNPWQCTAQLENMEALGDAETFMRNVGGELSAGLKRAQNPSAREAEYRSALGANWPNYSTPRKISIAELKAKPAPHIMLMKSSTQSPSEEGILNQMGALFAPLLRYSPLAMLLQTENPSPSTPTQPSQAYNQEKTKNPSR
jgi:hypothetical protein